MRVFAIAKSLLKHCLWYFVRDDRSPVIRVCDDEEEINLGELYEQYMHDAATIEEIDIGDQKFSITHIKFAPHQLNLTHYLFVRSIGL